MSLNSIVNNLVRAAASVPSNISDSDLDAHVAQLLADEAKARDKKWSDLGLRAFLSEGSASPDPNAPRPNKRFLASVIRTVDGHNAALLKQQAAAARDVRIERGDERPRAGPSKRSALGPGRLFGGAMKDAAGSTARNGRSGDGLSKRRMRGWSDDDDDYERPKRTTREGDREDEHRSNRRYDYSDDDRRRSRGLQEDDKSRRTSRNRHDETRDQDDDDYDGVRRKSRSGDEHVMSPQRRRHRDPDVDARRRKQRDEDTDTSPRHARHRTPDEDHRSDRHPKPRSRSPERTSRLPLHPPPPPIDRPPPAPSEHDLSPSASPPPAPLSKMDKYFTSSYNPVLDVGEVPKEGMITAVGWDNMLAILQERGKKRRQRSPGLFDDPGEIPKVSLRRSPSPSSDALRRLEKEERRARKEARRRRRTADEGSEDELARERRRKDRKATEIGSDMFATDYVKQGGVREWDKGK